MSYPLMWLPELRPVTRMIRCAVSETLLCGEVVSLHDLSLKYSSCFFASFPLGHFIIDNICHRRAAALTLMWRRPGREVWWRQNYFGFRKTCLLSTLLQLEKAPTWGAHTIKSHKKFQQRLVRHQYIVSRTKLVDYHETEEEAEYRSCPVEPMSNHYFSV